MLHARITKSLLAAAYKAIEKIGMTIKRNNNNQTMKSICYNLINRNKKSARVKMGMIKNAN